MKVKRIKAVAAAILFLIAGVLYSANRSQDIFLLETREAGSLPEEASAGEQGRTSREESVSQAETGLSDTKGQKESSSGSSESPGETALIRVHVCGAVKKAGVYQLKEGAIVEEALEAAGGVVAGGAADYLNLAGRISDGEKVYVPFLKDLENPYGEPSDPVASSFAQPEGDAGAAGSLVNINTADRTQLMTLPGIGQTRADAILAYRESSGAFQKIEDIMNVSGIKEGAFKKIKDRITV